MDSDFYRIFNKLLKLKMSMDFGFRTDFEFKRISDFVLNFLLRILTDFGFSKVKRILFLETFLNIVLICKFPTLLYLQIPPFCIQRSVF